MKTTFKSCGKWQVAGGVGDDVRSLWRSSRLSLVTSAPTKKRTRHSPTLNPQPSTLSLAPRGLGLLVGLEVSLPDGAPATDATLRLVKAMLRRGFVLLPEGEHSNIISFTPPLTISPDQLQATVNALRELLVQ
jgi:acetylornithine/succinyldiaminopimelate/putrescine aminotransferase